MTGIHSAVINGEWQSYVKDTHGDVTALLDASGNMLASYEYDAFGNQLMGDTAPNPFGYCGEYLDSETGLIYLRNRYYNSATGRFITEDPAKDGANWYVYANNNPVMFVDPMGLDIYYFAIGEFKKEASKDFKALSKQTDEPIHIIEVNTKKDFINEWNMMGNWDGKDVSVSMVILNMHGSPSSLSLGGFKRITTEDIVNETLKPKNIDGSIVVLGCNSGHYDHRYSSLVNKLLVKNNVKSVIASDGTVYNRSLLGNYTSKTDNEFVEHLWSGKKYRNNFGFIKYTKNSNGELEWEFVGKKISVKKLIDITGLKVITPQPKPGPGPKK